MPEVSRTSSGVYVVGGQSSPTAAPSNPLRFTPPRPRIAKGKQRTSLTTYPFPPTYFAPHAVPDPLTFWHEMDLDRAPFETVNPLQMMQLLCDLSPDISRALWDWLRLCNSGWEVTVYRQDETDPSEEGHAIIDAFFDRITEKQESSAMDVVWNRLYTASFLRGAILAQLIFDRRGRSAVGLFTPDPLVVSFKRVTDENGMPYWQMGQWQESEWVSLEDETIRYVPVDPFPGLPYGRPIAGPAIFATLFMMSLLRDLKRVIAQQGYPRLDLEIVTENLLNMMPVGLSPEEAKSWVDDVIGEVTTAYAQLEPDDAYVHLDVVKVNNAVGAIDASSLGGAEAIFTILERQMVRALKTTPLLMGIADGSLGETLANRQWEIHVQGIKSVQHAVEQVGAHLLGLVLQAEGFNGRVVLRFAELRQAEIIRDEQALSMKIANAAEMRDQGWITQDDASHTVTGHDAVAEAPARAGDADVSDNAPPPEQPLEGEEARAFVRERVEAELEHITRDIVARLQAA